MHETIANRVNPPRSTGLLDDSFGDVPGVLIVDDNRGIRDLTSRELQNRGFEVWTAASNLEALENYRLCCLAIDLVVIGVGMPGRDGPETLADLRAFNPHVRACFMTGYSAKYTERDLLALGALRVFWKPFGMGDFSASITALTAPSLIPAGERLSAAAFAFS